MEMILNSILLLDDNEASNYVHEKFMMKAECTKEVVKFQSGYSALEYLKTEENSVPEMIFMDINMPEMNGWEFLENIKKIERVMIKQPFVVLLSTSLSPIDNIQARTSDLIRARKLKPLSVTDIKVLVKDYFSWEAQ